MISVYIMPVKIGPYYYRESTRKNKKLMVNVNGKIIHFGDPSMEQYRDKTGIWSHLDHNDKVRRNNYLSRARDIKNKQGELTAYNPNYANWHSINVLW